MTITQHEGRCAKVLWVDIQFGRDCRNYGIVRDRLYCFDGHTVYVDGQAPAQPVRVEKPRLEDCARCGEPFEVGDGRAFMYCGDCREIRRIEQLQNLGPKRGRPTTVKICAGCHRMLEVGQVKYHDAVCRQAHLAVLRIARRQRQQEAMAGVFS